MKDETYEDFLNRLKEERCRLGMSQEELGRKLRMTQSHYSKAETGTRRFTYYELQCLCNTDIDVYYVFTGHRYVSSKVRYLEKQTVDELKCYMDILCRLVLYMDKTDSIALAEDDKKKIACIMNSQIRAKGSRTGLFWLRIFLDYNQTEMAGLLGMDIKKLRNLEAGKLLPDSEIIWKISEMFCVPYMLMVHDKKGMISQIWELIDMAGCSAVASMIRSLKYANEFFDKFNKGE